MSQNEFGKVFKRAWGDRDFKALTVDEQLLYIKLLSQPDISLAGVLTYAPVRWATQSRGVTVADIERTFNALQEKNFAVADTETQEVLVRSYIRNDLGWRSPRTMIGVANAVGRVLSPLLRGMISRELTRLDTSGLSDTISEKTNRSTRDVVESTIQSVLDEFPPLDTLSAALGNRVSDRVCDTPSDTLSDGVSAVRALNYNDNDSSNGSSNDKHNPSPSTAADAPAAKESDADAKQFELWWNQYDKKVDKKAAKQKWKIARRSTSFEVLMEASAKYINSKRESGKHPEFTKNPSVWLNGECWNDEIPRSTGSRPADQLPVDAWGTDRPDPFSLYAGDEQAYLEHLQLHGWTREQGRWTE